MSEARLLRKGKVKDLYGLPDGKLIFVFSDRVSAFDVLLASEIPRKGEILAHFAEFWFNTLDVSNHMIALEESNRLVVKSLRMIPLECIVRGYLYGSLHERVKAGKALVDGDPILAAKLPKPVFDPTTKSELKDVPMSRGESISGGITTPEEFDRLGQTSIALYESMADVVSKAGFILADVKFEFGKNEEGEIMLADSLGPDEFRLWPRDNYSVGRLQDSYDKQLIRDWLTEQGFKATFAAATFGGKKVIPPVLPQGLVAAVTKRYLEAYRRITGRSL